MTTIGVAIPGVLSQNYLGEVFRGIADTTKQHRASLLVSIQNPTRSDDLDQLFGTGGCDGVITAVPYRYMHVLEQCRLHGREVVQIDSPTEANIDGQLTVQVDNQAAISNIMAHLVALGHRRIGFVTGRLEDVSAQQRLQGYRDGLAAAGIPFDPALVWEGDWTYKRGSEVAEQVLDFKPRPTALVASDDVLALSVANVARRRGLVIGRDLSLTGFNDDRMAGATGLTTVRQPMYELGKTAVELLLKRLNGEPIPELHVTMPTELIIRQSTGPAPQET